MNIGSNSALTLTKGTRPGATHILLDPNDSTANALYGPYQRLWRTGNVNMTRREREQRGQA